MVREEELMWTPEGEDDAVTWSDPEDLASLGRMSLGNLGTVNQQLFLKLVLARVYLHEHRSRARDFDEETGR